MNAQSIVDNRQRIMPHTAGPDHVMCDLACVTQKFENFAVRLHFGARLQFLIDIIGQWFCCSDLSALPDCPNGGLPVIFSVQETEPDGGGRMEIARTDVD